jgi:hypothetical protein
LTVDREIDLGQSKLNKAYLGLLLVAVAVLLSSLFFLDDYHDFFWSNPAVFIIFTTAGVCSALAGGALVGRNLLPVWQGRRKALTGIFIGIGAVLAIVGVLLGVAAIGLAIGVSFTGYWGHPVNDYEGDYLIMGLQVVIFQLSIVPEIAGGFLFGFGLLMRSGTE